MPFRGWMGVGVQIPYLVEYRHPQGWCVCLCCGQSVYDGTHCLSSLPQSRIRHNGEVSHILHASPTNGASAHIQWSQCAAGKSYCKLGQGRNDACSSGSLVVPLSFWIKDSLQIEMCLSFSTLWGRTVQTRVLTCQDNKHLLQMTNCSCVCLFVSRNLKSSRATCFSVNVNIYKVHPWGTG